MLEYTLRKLGQGMIVVVLSTVILFSLMQLMPGDPISMISDPLISDSKKQEMRIEWGLDKPAPVRYLYWVKNVLKGDLGTSIVHKEPVMRVIMDRLPYTLLLMIPSTLIHYLISVPVGLIAAYKKNSIIDKTIVVSALILWSIPGFFIGILLIKFISVDLALLPISGYDGAKSLVLPITALVLPGFASTLRIVRSEVLEVTRSRFVDTAYAKGLNTRRVLFGHILRNALIPTTVQFFLSIPGLIGGAIIIENIFAIPGMGNLVFGAIAGHDYPIVQGFFLITAILTVLSNTMGDVVAALLNPRIKLAMKGEKK